MGVLCSVGLCLIGFKFVVFVIYFNFFLEGRGYVLFLFILDLKGFVELGNCFFLVYFEIICVV
ncbi:hypothetical protein DF186_20800, partial [Enterococcus hirae]